MATQQTMDPVVHFEMPVIDRKRLVNFYSAVFGWKMDITGEDMGHYVMATTTETGDKGPKVPGAINGGFYTISEKERGKAPHVVISVEDMKKSMGLVKSHGGQIIEGPMDIPTVGIYVIFTDTEGNRVCMLQPAMSR